MSYLDVPRMNFTGMFQADVSTINNDVANFDIATFNPQQQELGKDGSWNPDGTGSFRLVGCKVSGARLGRDLLATPEDDPAIGMLLENSGQRVSGKLVDLDPQQQMVSAIWGMQVRLADGAGNSLMLGDYRTAAFTNLWKRQQHQTAMNDQTLAAVFQSVLCNVAWHGSAGSPLLEALRAASDDGWLSINMNVYGYGRDPSIARYTLGHVAGSIGPHRAAAPKQFVIGRQMIPLASGPLVPRNGVSFFTCVVDEAGQRLSADFGNCLPIEGADGGFENLGPLLLALDKDNAPGILTTVAPASVQVLGEVGYQRGDAAAQAAWYAQTAGIEDIDYSAAGAWVAQHIGRRQLLLLTPQAGSGAPAAYQVVVQESIDGLYVRADDFVYRLEPGQTAEVELFASRYGKPVAATLASRVDLGLMGGDASQPPINTGKLEYPAQLATDASGHALLRIHAPVAGPGNPRGYIDGQLYGVGYRLAEQAEDIPRNNWNFISLLVFNRIELPAQPAWFPDIEPIFKQYANLYPIMSRHLIDLGDYDAVVPHVRILAMAFGLPRSDPNHMPVTRDLSEAKRDMILQWLHQPGPDGKPHKGVTPPPRVLAAPAPKPALNLEPLQTAGKSAVVLAYEARRGIQGEPS